MNSERNWDIYRLLDQKYIKPKNDIPYNPQEKLISILKRISDKTGKEKVTLLRLKEKKKKTYIIQLKKKDETDLNHITKDMGLHEKELLSRINQFKKDMIDFERDKNKNFNKFFKIKKLNDYFAEMYKNLHKRKNKRARDSIIEKEFLFNIANQYLLNKTRLPDMSRNIFNANPLILDNEQIKKFFVNNKVKSGKFMKYIERIKDIVDRKINGSYKLNAEERSRIENIIKNEKPKGYISPEKLIPILKKEISKTQNTYDHLIKEYKSKTIEEPKNTHNRPKIIKRSSIYDISRLKITKKVLSEEDNKNNDNSDNNKNINNINNKNNNNKNNHHSININNSSIDDTTLPFESKNINIKTPRYNIFERKNSQTMIMVSPIRNRLQSHTLRDVDMFVNDLDKSNQNNFVKDLDPAFSFRSGKVNSIFLKKSFNLNNSNIDKDLNLNLNNSSLLQNNKLELFTPKKKIDFLKLINNHRLEKEKEKVEHSSLKDVTKILQNSFRKNNETNDFLKHLLHGGNNTVTPNKIHFNSKFDFFKKRMTKVAEKKNERKKEIQKSNHTIIENLYNKALNLKAKSYDDEVELENYLTSSRGQKNIDKLMSLKHTYYNIARMENIFLKQNWIKRDYLLRYKVSNKSFDYTDKQKQALDKTKFFAKSFVKQASKFRKVICEKGREENDD